jgi:hypothetical protein
MFKILRMMRVTAISVLLVFSAQCVGLGNEPTSNCISGILNNETMCYECYLCGDDIYCAPCSKTLFQRIIDLFTK